ncbi:hypothetical protein B0675_40215 [Streptomyces sp. M41(2017)]|uniref:hypothetical protein n=1 Tax=Streptomyces sp. M41(2017) TaxID=1955065 RepID=UPI0009C098F7|nr:hypothetical protein [Streptomyces sp. M41(2017)]OQQ13045.1 hypothetical protein B0675_40215 [Streptomyces sp. M41(2017)]
MNSELSQDALTVGLVDEAVHRRAAVRVADQIGREHPDPRDDLMPRLVGRELARDPLIAASYLELLDQLGLKPEHIRRRP